MDLRTGTQPASGPRGVFGASLMLGAMLLASGCAPRLIQDYEVRQADLVFAVQEGTSYQLGDCQRAQNGQLSNCQVYEVEFK